MVLVNLGSVHTDVEHWGDPENFRPERFIDSTGKFCKDDHLILFGTGKNVEAESKMLMFLCLQVLGHVLGNRLRGIHHS
jgi:hypothetical protein